MTTKISALPAYAGLLDEVLELLNTTTPRGAQPVRFRLQPDRRTRHEPPPEHDRRGPDLSVSRRPAAPIVFPAPAADDPVVSQYTAERVQPDS